jgi:hypothetical protein
MQKQGIGYHKNNDVDNENNNNWFIIYFPSQQLQANYRHSTVLIQLHYEHTKYVYKVKDKLQASTEEKHINAGKQTNTQTNKDEG